MFSVPVTLNFNLEWSNSTRYKNDELVIKTQDLSLDRNVLKKNFKKAVFIKFELKYLQPEKGNRTQSSVCWRKYTDILKVSEQTS